MNSMTLLKTIGGIAAGFALLGAGVVGGRVLALSEAVPDMTPAAITSENAPLANEPAVQQQFTNPAVASPTVAAMVPQTTPGPGMMRDWSGDWWDEHHWEMGMGAGMHGYNNTPGYGWWQDHGWGMMGPGYAGTPNPGGWNSGHMGQWDGHHGNMGGSWESSGEYVPPASRLFQPIATLEDAIQQVESYLITLNNPDLIVAEAVQFQYAFYVRVWDENADLNAVTMLVDSQTGQIWPEPGPNMAWNGWYTQSPAQAMTITDTQARDLAAASTAIDFPDSRLSEPAVFDGYYTFEVWQDDILVSFISVRGTSGEVWYHAQYGVYTDHLIP